MIVAFSAHLPVWLACTSNNWITAAGVIFICNTVTVARHQKVKGHGGVTRAFRPSSRRSAPPGPGLAGCQLKRGAQMNSAPRFPGNTCRPINSIKHSSSHSEPVSRADLPGDCKKLENATIKPEKTGGKCGNFNEEKLAASLRNHAVPVAGRRRETASYGR